MKIATILIITFSLMLLSSCMAPNVQKKLEEMTARQDSMLTILKAVEAQSAFVAKKVGWTPPDDTLPINIPLGNSYYQGAKKPVLTIVEFSDFECTYCAKAAPVLDSLVKVYPEKIRVVFKHFPLSFHKKAMAAHAAAIAAGQQGRFFDYRYKLAPLFRQLNDSTFIALAEQIGLDMEVFKKDMLLTPETKGKIEDDMQLGRKIGVRGTPSLYANGKKVMDRSFDGFVRLLKKYGG